MSETILHFMELLPSILISVSIIVIAVLVLLVVLLLRNVRRLQSELQQVRAWPQRPQSSPDVSPGFTSPAPPYRAGEAEQQRAKRTEEAHPLAQVSLADTHTSPLSPQNAPFRQDRPVVDEHWLKLVQECVDLYNDLDKRLASFDPSRHELVEYVLLQLQEILERCGVELIDGDTVFERSRHQPERPAAGVVAGETIIETVSPGFAVGARVLRRARVRLADTPSREIKN